MKQNLKFFDLQAINQLQAEEMKQAAARVIDSGWYLRGEETLRFEESLARYLSAPHVVGVANGLDALRLIFRSYISLGVMKEGDEVIVPANTFIATVLAITDCGLVPHFVDPDPETHNLPLEELHEHITPRTRAICVVHLYGRVCWSESLVALAEKYQLKIVEDNAQALGAETPHAALGTSHKAGALGDAAAISFYPAKNLGALGDGGAVITRDEELAERVRALGNYGSATKYHHLYTGLNSRLDELQAAFLSVKLNHLDAQNQQRNRLAKRYSTLLHHPSVQLPTWGMEGEQVWHQYVVRSSRRDALQKHLAACGIETQIHYPIPPHRQPCYAAYAHLSLPVAEQLAGEVLSLPISPLLTFEQQEYVVCSIHAFGE